MPPRTEQATLLKRAAAQGIGALRSHWPLAATRTAHLQLITKTRPSPSGDVARRHSKFREMCTWERDERSCMGVGASLGEYRLNNLPESAMLPIELVVREREGEREAYCGNGYRVG